MQENELDVTGGQQETARSGRRRRTAWVTAGAAIALTSIGVAVATESGPFRTRAVAAVADAFAPPGGRHVTSCPEEFPGDLASGRATRVPAPPRSLEGESALAPPGPVDEMIVCAYGSGSPESRGAQWLQGRRVLPPDEARRAQEDLRGRPMNTGGDRVCTAMAGPQLGFLVGMATSEGTWWVATPYDVNKCVGASNGRFITDDFLGDKAVGAFLTGRWEPGSHADLPWLRPGRPQCSVGAEDDRNGMPGSASPRPTAQGKKILPSPEPCIVWD